MSDAHTATTPAATWNLNLRSGSALCVPPTLSSLTTFVLLEQESWFEPELAWLPRFLKPGMRTLDIGANHGVYTVELARAVGAQGHVWAFEPTRAPRQRLLDSLKLNGLAERVSVIDAGLAEQDGTARFAVQSNSELNSRTGQSSVHETVRLLALDGFLAQVPDAPAIDFVKLDAEGDELRVLAGGARFFSQGAPLVMFEFKHGARSNLPLVQAFRTLGCDIFRLSPELGVLLPFDPATDETALALNLFAASPERQQALAARGLLVTRQALDEPGPAQIETEALTRWHDRPALRGALCPLAAPQGEALSQAALAVAAAHLQRDLSAAQRAALMVDARDRIQSALHAGQEQRPQAWVLLMHTLQALGQPVAAVALGRELLRQWPVELPACDVCVPPLLDDLHRRRSTALGPWLRQCVAEFVAMRGGFSSYFAPPAPQAWAELLQHPDHGAEVERRYVLAQVRANRQPDLGLLTCLPAAEHTCNGALWQQVLAGFEAAPACPSAAEAGLTPDGVLARLPADLRVGVVDVGAVHTAPAPNPMPRCCAWTAPA